MVIHTLHLISTEKRFCDQLAIVNVAEIKKAFAVG